MPLHRDIEAFEQRAQKYERGLLGRLHKEIIKRSTELVLTSGPEPRRVLDVGTGTGFLLRELARLCPDASELVGVDPAQQMTEVATAKTNDPRVSYLAGVGAEHLPFEDGAFDVITAVTSFDHWADQRLGLFECHRVLAPGGRFVLVDLFNVCFYPTLLLTHRGKARTKRRATRLLRRCGFQTIEWRGLYSTWMKAVVTTRGD